MKLIVAFFLFAKLSSRSSGMSSEHSCLFLTTSTELQNDKGKWRSFFRRCFNETMIYDRVLLNYVRTLIPHTSKTMHYHCLENVNRCSKIRFFIMLNKLAKLNFH